ncbi:MAG TPA: hypothetical protein PKA10_17285 [Selenomonadales bacterium]|nr:hypothetical protein [Selenomonadales bacterium]
MKKVSLFVVVALLVVSFSGVAMAAADQSAAPSQGNWYCPNYGQYYNSPADDQNANGVHGHSHHGGGRGCW